MVRVNAKSATVLGVAVVAALAIVWLRPSPSGLVLDLNGKAVDPIAEFDGRAAVLIFTRSDCPISNRYAPEVQRLYDRFSSSGIRFWLVYVDPDESAGAISEHLKTYGYAVPALRDTRHELVQATGASVTPEAAVFTSTGGMVYRGRIDNRYVSFDKRRSTASERDLENVLEALAAGIDVEVRETRAVGCVIADLQSAQSLQ